MNTFRSLNTAVNPAELGRARRSFVIVGIALPLVIGFAGVLLMLQWLPELPDPAATHWSGAGEPDGFGPGWTFPMILGIMSVLFPLLLGGMVMLSTRRGRWGGMIRFLGAFLPGFVAFLAVALAWSVAVQRGLEDARAADDGAWGLLVGAGVGVVIGVVCWFVRPTVEVGLTGAAPEESITLEPDTRAVWVRSVRTARGGTVAITLSTVALGGAAIVVASTGSPAAWPLGVVAVVLTALGIMFLAFDVTVDERGLTVRSAAGFPTWHVPVADISEVRVSDVNPLVDYGGWGVRQAPGGRFGIVVRSGEALEVHRRSGKIFVVTVDDAARAAALLQAFAQRKE